MLQMTSLCSNALLFQNFNVSLILCFEVIETGVQTMIMIEETEEIAIMTGATAGASGN